MGGHNIVRVDERMLVAASLAAEGKSAVEIAKEFGVHPTTVRAWLKNEQVQEEIYKCLRARVAPAVAKAFGVIEKQLESKAASGFLAQNAAREVMTRYGGKLQEENDNALKVVFVNGNVPIGMPEDTSAEAEDLTDDV